MNSIDERCYGYEPAQHQLYRLRYTIKELEQIIKNMKEELDTLKKK